MMFARPNGFALTGVEAALALLLDGLEPVAPVEVPLIEVAGCVAAGQPPLAQALPTADEAVIDGWAFAAADLAGASAYSPFVPVSPPSWVEVGQPMPVGCDCVLEPGLVEEIGPLVQVLAEAVPGQGVRRAGTDLPAGHPPVAAGRPVSPADLLPARRAGVIRLQVRRPSLRIIDIAASDGASSASETVAELARAAGASIPAGIETTGRAVADIVAALDAGSADLVVLVGGTGAGRSDEVAAALAAHGALGAHGIAMAPGRTTAIGRLRGIPAIALPGAPDQALAGFLVLVLPVIDRLTARCPRQAETLPLARKIASSIGVTELVLLRRGDRSWMPLAAGTLPLQCVAAADAWLTVGANSEGFAAGAEVSAFALRNG
ncbi:molybdopterin biosynthesis enzyme [Pseudaminobacter salicylatoxidans]|uniref:Molybdopterin molybdenumtransferase n=1 Tax=Pseudaminobacter salicylatoxidans TaxID=93369 RepID=A0A316C7U8_PSESE|nr:molybdopterin-binding protein [Pseudaminobacter salicylatoxidans]PWJ84147.1 molybdopterin biosynthesis enzyme [Pseudaminobacter salicylatoxidans]